MISGALMSLCLLLSDSVSYASARDLLQSSVQLQSYPVDSTPQSYVPAPAPAAQPSNNALKALLTSLQGKCHLRGNLLIHYPEPQSVSLVCMHAPGASSLHNAVRLQTKCMAILLAAMDEAAESHVCASWP